MENKKAAEIKKIINQLNKLRGTDKRGGDHMAAVSEILGWIARVADGCKSCAVQTNSNLQMAAGIGHLAIPTTLLISPREFSPLLRRCFRENKISGDFISTDSPADFLAEKSVDVSIFCPVFDGRKAVDFRVIENLLRFSHRVLGVCKSEFRETLRSKFPDCECLSTVRVQVEVSAHYKGSEISYDVFLLQSKLCK